MDVDLYALPHTTLANGKTEHSLDNVILAFCPWCGNGTVILNPDEWWVSRKHFKDKPSNKDFIGRACSYCFAAAQIPERAEYDALVSAGQEDPGGTISDDH